MESKMHRRAYTQKLGPSWVIFIESPVGGRWLELRSHADSQAFAEDWIRSLGYKLVTKAQSYERAKEEGE
jgi:hypothetical protein